MSPPCVCECCRVVRAVVYCKSDDAPLCLKCDQIVHSANVISCRHYRSLICDRCNSQAAVLRCLQEELCFCENCANACYFTGHRHVNLIFYDGCPSLTDLTKLWPFVLEDSSYLHDLMANEASACSSSGGAVVPNEISPDLTFDQWPFTPPPLPPPFKYACSIDPRLKSSYSQDLVPFLPQESTLQKQGCSENAEDNIGLQESVSVSICSSPSIDTFPPSFHTEFEIFENVQNQSKYHNNDATIFNSTVTDSNIIHPETPIDQAASSSGQQDCLSLQVSQVSSSGQQDCLSLQASQVLSSGQQDCLSLQASQVGGKSMLMNSNLCLGFGNGQVPTSIPLTPLTLSNHNGESNGTEYQDCVILRNDTPWDSNFEVVSCALARDKALMRYNEKKKTRT